MFLTNKPLSFQKTHVTETGLTDYHKLIITTFFKSHFTRLRSKVITYRNYKKFDENVFRNDLQKLDIKLDEENSESSYSLLSNKFLEVVNKHAPLRKKILRGSHSPFATTKELQKAIYTRSKLKNKMNQNPSRENVLAYKKQRNICVSLRRKPLKKHLKSITEKGINTNKSFWKFIKPFLTNKGFIRSNDITLVENNVVTTDGKTLSSTFNKHYINIVEISSGKPQKIFQKCHMVKANWKYSVMF